MEITKNQMATATVVTRSFTEMREAPGRAIILEILELEILLIRLYGRVAGLKPLLNKMHMAGT